MKSPTVLNTPIVLKISSYIDHDIPHSTEQPHGTQDIPHDTHDIPHGTEHPHGTEYLMVHHTHYTWCCWQGETQNSD